MGTTKFDRVIVGDSILRLGEDELEAENSFFDCEDGRGVTGRGTLNRLSATEAVRLYIPMVNPGGYFVFQDNSLNGTPAQWATLMSEIVTLAPDNINIIGVLPICVAPLQQFSSEVAAKANVMISKFNTHPLREYVRWNQKVASDPATYVYDGQHPTEAGSDWLGEDIDRATGF